LGKTKLAAAEVASIDLLGDPGCGTDDPDVLCTRTTSFVVRVRVNRVNGGSKEQSVFCGVGGQYTILCTETPEIRIGGPTLDGGGYRDVPCSGENGERCATPLPSPEPKAVAAARPLDVDALDIPIDHVGHYAVEVGRAVLPNGVVSRSRFTLADPTPESFSVVPESGVQLDVRSLDDGAPPFDNYYLRGWHPGTEQVVVTLTFDVTAFSPGAVLQVRSLIVE
jgi:hypothetical protein